MRIAEQSAAEIRRRVLAVHSQVDVEIDVHEVGIYQFFRPRTSGTADAGVFTFDSGAIHIDVSGGTSEDVEFRKPLPARIIAAVDLLLEHARGDAEHLPWATTSGVSD